MPALYREPLILCYREHPSVEHVATWLDLTEDNVKQRLARGHKILQEPVLIFVEGALVRNTPGKVRRPMSRSLRCSPGLRAAIVRMG